MAQTCVQLGCGAHGTCNEYQMCVCSDGWAGRLCEVPPPQDMKCTPSDDAFRAANKNGDLACGNYGVYGTCLSTGTCDCTNIGEKPVGGTRCEIMCTADTDCGSAGVGTCDMTKKRCVCENGWSGNHCMTPPPPPASCTKDADCARNGVIRGKCDTTNKRCVCNRGLTGNFIYVGDWCETVLDEPEAVSQDPSIANAIVSSMVTPQFLTNYVLSEVSERAVTYLLKNGFAALIKSAVANRLSTAVASTAVAKLTTKLGSQLALKMETMLVMKMLTSTVFRTTGRLLTRVATSLAGGPLMTALMTLIQVWGMLLDGFDVRGLNMQMGQSMIDMVGMGIANQLNKVPALVDAGIYYPHIAYPSDTVDWTLQLMSTDNQIEMLNDIADYISRLSVNSDGQDIVAQPGSTVAAYRASVAAANTRPFYTALSGGNVTRAAWLKENELWFWPTLGGGLLLLVGMLVWIGLAARKKDTGVS